MGDVNKVWLNGVVTTEPVMTQVGHDTPSTGFVLKVDESFVDRSGNNRIKSNFIEIEALGRQSSKVKSTIKQGERVWVEGYLRQEKSDNQSIVKVRVFAVYKDDTDSFTHHMGGMRAALNIIKRSRDISSAIKEVEGVINK